LKLGSRRGIATDLICGRGDRVRLGLLLGGAEHGVPVVLPGRHFLGAKPLASLEYPCCVAGVSGQPVEVFFGKGFG
jgi:hypothetical protein